MVTDLNRWRYFDIGLSRHEIWNPTSEAKLTQLAKLLAPKPENRVLDAGCGRAEFAIRLIERFGCSVVGVDASPYAIPRARQNAAQRVAEGKLTLIEADAADYAAEPASFDIAMCVGASWIWDGFRGTLQALADVTKPGGKILCGEPFFRKEPASEYLAAENMPDDAFETHAGNVQTGVDLGLRPFYTAVSNHDEWDYYESLQWYAIETWAAENPGDPDRDAMLAESHKHRDLYLNWGRDTLGWALYLFLKPE